METRQQCLTFISAVLVLIATLVIIQLWLLAASIEAVLGQEMEVLVPAAVASGALFLMNGALLWYVASFDERLRQWGPRG